MRYDHASLVGRGRLSWHRNERVTDRYGAVFLDTDTTAFTPVKLQRPAEGERGTLFAVVEETRQSGHIGDLLRGIFPTTPNVGEVIMLGAGTVFHASVEGHDVCIGLKPDDGRDCDWLDPQALYRCHDQTVTLMFLKEV